MAARLDLSALLDRSYPAVMGVLNITPDSFSDGGDFIAPERALAQARTMIAAGADIIDIGAESTRPYGARPVTADEEMGRLEPVLCEVAALGVPVSIDSMKSTVVAWALDRGAAIANDVWGLQRDPAMAETVAETGAAVVVMHNRESVDAGLDITADMKRFFDHSLDLARKAGILRAHIMLDPGIGFGKTKDQNLAALRATDRLSVEYGLPVLIGVSRKSLFGLLLGAAVDARLIGTLAANLATLARGARVFRVHDVAEHKAAFAVWDAIEHG